MATNGCKWISLPDPYLVAAAIRSETILSHYTELDLPGVGGVKHCALGPATQKWVFKVSLEGMPVVLAPML